jgi:hypothetical protein
VGLCDGDELELRRTDRGDDPLVDHLVEHLGHAIALDVGVADDEPKRLTLHAAYSGELLDGQHQSALEARALIRCGARKRQEHADRDTLVGRVLRHDAPDKGHSDPEYTQHGAHELEIPSDARYSR